MDKSQTQKIGIITVHKNTNYGANLQAFASCEYLNKQGYNASVIDYTMPSHEKNNHIFSWLYQSWKNDTNKSLSHKIKLLIALILSFPHKNKRLKGFYNFRKNHMKLTTPCKDIKDIEKLGLDTIVCGSDQIWNPDITEGINPIYFGAIDGIKNKVAYAPSVGKEKYQSQDEEQIVKLLKEVDYLSVREEDSAKYLSEISSRHVQCVCDPVFLLEKNDYEVIASKKPIKGNYVLLYSIIANSELVKTAKQYADRHKLKLVEICQEKTKGANHKQVCGLSPEEFLGAIRYADAVFTNSFHGTAFSLIFEKEFYVFNNKGRGSRITNLLKMAGTEQRLIEEYKEDKLKLDYTDIKENLKPYIEKSKNYLNNALSSKKRVLTEKCLGCGACLNVCKRDALRFVKNEEGFNEALLDINKCGNCNLCRKVCPALNQPIKNPVSNEIYAFKAKDELRANSASGGAFVAIATEILKEGGSVYGASFNSEFKTEHIRIEKTEDLKLIQGTKYLQSNTKEMFGSIEQDLLLNKKVLFSGTPCQVDAVNRYLDIKKTSKDNLFTVDIICHGVPSSKVFDEFILYLNKEFKSNVALYKFRYKPISWRGNSCFAELENDKKVFDNKKLNVFMNLYYSNNITRESCYNCQYTTKERVSDLTISDYWGIEEVNKEFEDKLGVSMVIVNTAKGKNLFNKAQGDKVLTGEYPKKQPQLSIPQERPQNREEFWSDFEKGDMKNIAKKYGGAKRPSLKSLFHKILK